jgi:hypothetical protein
MEAVVVGIESVITKPLSVAHKKDVGRTAFHAASYGKRYTYMRTKYAE